jgi:hypothetical protein
MPLPVHSYCLDMYAKACYRRLGHVALDGIWHWREMCALPRNYGLDADFSPYPKSKDDSDFCGIRKEDEDDFFHHQAGKEWMAANPVEIPELEKVLGECLDHSTPKTVARQSQSHLFVLPAELIDHVFALLDVPDLLAMAGSCRTLRYHAQPFFRRRVLNKDCSWLWEISEGGQYPASPDRPVNWDPCNTPGLTPTPPLELGTEETEAKVWAQIVADDPEMSAISDTVRLFNSQRRETISSLYRAQSEESLRDWQDFRVNVADWIRLLPPKVNCSIRNVDWVRLWLTFLPHKTAFPGIRNRARIWEDCERILDLNARFREHDFWDSMQEVTHTVLGDIRNTWWEKATRTASANNRGDVWRFMFASAPTLCRSVWTMGTHRCS